MEAKLQKNPNLDKVIAPIMLSRIALLLSLQSKLYEPDIVQRRNQMIEAENLHIKDTISYDEFQILYKKYGIGLNKKEFAKAFLDIDDKALYEIEKQGQDGRKTAILTNEYVSKEEFLSIKENVIHIYKLKPLDIVNYDILIQMYNNCGKKLSLKMFAEKVLGVEWQVILNIRRGKRSKNIEVLSDKKQYQDYIGQIKRKVLNSKNGIHIKDEISFEKFEELYREFEEIISKKEFAVNVLELDESSYYKLSSKKRKSVVIFKDYIINPNDIYCLREKVILKENLHIGDLISYDEFKMLYQKYGGILPEDLFAERILDVSLINLNYLKNNNRVSILKNLEITEKYTKSIKEIIANNKKFQNKQLITYDEFNQLYVKYGAILSKQQFITLVLGGNVKNYNNLNVDITKSMNILLPNKNDINFPKLRRKVIQENNLHYGDKITYVEFNELYKRHAPENIEETVFAEEILDIDSEKLYNLKRNKDKKQLGTPILLKEKLPTEEEFEEIKQNIIYKEKLHINDKINYERFEILHRKYGGIVPDYMFAEKILDIQKRVLSSITPPKDGEEKKYNKDKEVIILTRTQMMEKDIESLKINILLDNFLYKDYITLEEFEILYKKYNHILSPVMFAEKVFGIKKTRLDGLTCKKVKKLQITIVDEKIKNEIKKASKLKNEFMKSSKRVRKVLDNYVSDENSFKVVSNYLNICRKIFKNGGFPKEELSVLGEAIEFIQGGLDEITLFSRICISFSEYKIANRFIAENIYNDGINKEDKLKLIELQNSIKYSIKKEEVLRLINNGDSTIKEIVKLTGLSELEVLEIQKEVRTGNNSLGDGRE